MRILPLLVTGAGSVEVNGMYLAKRPAQVPIGFRRTCDQMKWDAGKLIAVGGNRL
jgi:hypothetical protein